MLCLKCNERQATVHLTSTFRHGGITERSETIDLCEECASVAGIGKANPAKIAARTITGKKCEFCGEDAVTGVGEMEGELPTYFCFACNLERSRILQHLFRTEAPEMIQRMKEGESHFDRMFDSAWKAKAKALSDKATRLLREQKRRDS